MSAIENLILKCVETHKEVKVNEMNVVNHRDAIDVQMRVSINGNVSIPHAVEQLQSQIKRYLAASSGIEVRNISVSVDKAPIADLPAAKEQLPEADPEPEVKPEPAPEKKEKLPVHQRIFGRDPEKTEAEQIAEAEYVTPDPAEEAPAETAEEGAAAEAPAEVPATQESAPQEETLPEDAPAAEDAEEVKQDE